MFFQRPSRTFIAGTMIICGSICAVISFASWLYCWHFVRTASQANGRVVKFVEGRGKDDEKIYASVFTFRDVQGKEHTVTSSTASTIPEHQVGDSVRVLYSPDDPQHAKTGEFFSMWGLPFVTGLAVAFYLPLGLVVWFWPEIIRQFRRKPPVIHGD